MNKKRWMIMGLLIAAALGVFIPQLIVEQAKGSPDEATYQFLHLGMTTSDAVNEMEQILDGIVGIVKVDMDPESDRITVTFDEETMKAEWIAKSLEAHGYPPESYKKLK